MTDSLLDSIWQAAYDALSNQTAQWVCSGRTRGCAEVPAVEKVVEATDRYVVVAKLGAGGREVAARLDPRAGGGE